MEAILVDAALEFGGHLKQNREVYHVDRLTRYAQMGYSVMRIATACNARYFFERAATSLLFVQ
jgi:hypothetical protein